MWYIVLFILTLEGSGTFVVVNTPFYTQGECLEKVEPVAKRVQEKLPEVSGISASCVTVPDGRNI